LNVSKREQRVLHALAQRGHIAYEKDDKGKIIEVLCVNREGWVLGDCTLVIFRKLKRRRLIASASSQPYRITRDELAAVRSQLDNR
jgi:uncharacterized protein YjhX (UPF0386 family)